MRSIRKLYWVVPMESREWCRVFYTLIPGKLGESLRRGYYKRRFKACGGRLHIAPHVTIYHPENMETGDWVQFSRCCHINASGGVKVGADTIIGPYVKIISANHIYDRVDVPIRSQGWIRDPVKIGNNVWIGTAAILLPGITIGDHSVVGAGAVVTKDVPQYSVSVGNPARIIKSINNE